MPSASPSSASDPRRSRRGLAGAIAGLLLGAVAPAQFEPTPEPADRAVQALDLGSSPNRVLLDDGRLLAGTVIAWNADELSIDVDGGEITTVRAASLVSVHGRRATPRRTARAILVGGEEFRGEVAGGDEFGDTFVIESPILGDRRIPLDRLRFLIFPSEEASVSAPDPSDFEMPEGADEVLFLPTESGLDRLVGEVYRFTRRSIRFQAESDDEPRGRLFRNLRAFGLRGGFDREDEPTHVLTTRAGDRIGVSSPSLRDGRLSVVLEGGDELSVAWSDVTALTSLDRGRVPLSECERRNVVQRSWFGDGSAPLFPLRVDRSVDGSLLSVAGLGGGGGLGVHAKTRFDVVVPDDCAALVGSFGIDDSAQDLSVRACVDVRVMRGDEVLVESKALRLGKLVGLGRLPVEPGQVLRFVVDFGPGLDLGDRVDWIDCVFVR